MPECKPNNRGPRRIIGIALAVCCAMAGWIPAWSQPAESADVNVKHPLATKQQIARDRMAQLEDRMFRLIDQLAEEEPEQAKRLQEALQRTRELLIARHMDETIVLLENGDVSDAADRQVAIMKDLEEVLKILLEQGGFNKERQEEIERLQAFRQRIDEMLEEQRGLKNRSDASPRLERLKQGLANAIARLESIIAGQEQVIGKTESASRSNDPTAAQPQAEAQGRVRAATDALSEDLKDPGNVPPSENEQKGNAEGNNDPPDNPAEPPETPDTAEPAAPAEPAEREDHGHDATEAGEDTEEAEIESAIRQARSDLNQASGRMQSAEGDLSQSQPGKALGMQNKALQSLKQALNDLKQQRGKVIKQLDQAEAAARQRELKNKADKLAEEMQGKKDNQDPNAPPPSAAPGADNMQQSGQHMDNAAQDLDQAQPAEASEDQQNAIEQLEQARQELEQVLEQLRREQQEELLRGLEARFRAMLAKQLTINKATQALQDKGPDRWAHADELDLAGIAQDEAKLSSEAGEALQILKEDGTTIVFPRIVEQLQQDMNDVAGRLRESKTGDITQAMETEIARSLEELIDAIQEKRKQLQSGQGQGQGGPNGNQPLLPDSAELKLLRALQERINDQTESFFDTHGEEPPPDSDPGQRLEHIAERQSEVAEMARKMHERITGQ